LTKNRKGPESARLCVNTVRDICTGICHSVFGISTFCFRHLCDLRCGAYTLLRIISVARYVFKSELKVLAFKGRSLPDIFREHVLSEVDNWKPQAGGRAVGPYGQSYSGRNDILSPLRQVCPQAFFRILSPRFFSYFARAAFSAGPQLHDWTPGLQSACSSTQNCDYCLTSAFFHSP